MGPPPIGQRAPVSSPTPIPVDVTTGASPPLPPTDEPLDVPLAPSAGAPAAAGGPSLPKVAKGDEGKKATAFKQQLADIPGIIKEDLYAALNDPAFMRKLLDDPSILDDLASGDMTKFIAACPKGPFKEKLRMYEGMTSNPLGAALAGGLGLQDAVKSAATGLKVALADPTTRETLETAIAMKLPIGTLLSDIETGKFDGAVLSRVMDGNAKPADMLYLLKYVQAANGGELKLDPSTLPKAITDKLPSDMKPFLAACKEIELGPGNKLTLTFKKDADLGLPIDIGEKLELNLDGLDENGLKATMDLSFGQAIAGFYKSLDFHPTGNDIFDGFLTLLVRLIMGILFPIVALGLAIAGPSAQITFKDGEGKVDVVSRFGDTLQTIPFNTSPK